MAWINVGIRLPEKEGKYKIKADLNPLPMFQDIQEIEVDYTIFNGNKMFHFPRGAQVSEWWEEEKVKKVVKSRKKK
jgi:hypothetical protein